MRRGGFRGAGAALLALGLAACTVGPTYQKLALPTPAAFSGRATTTGAVADGDLAQWWRTFDDPVLNGLIQRALADNLDLETAVSRVRQARAQLTTARATEWPSVNASGNAVDFHSNHGSSGGGSTGGGSGALGLPIPSDLHLYSAGFDASWEVDLFGGGRRQIEAAKASVEAAQWGRRDVQVSLTAEVASDYLALRLAQARLALGREELQRQKDLYAAIAARRKTGFVTNLDVNQQTVQVETAAAQLPELEAAAQTQVHAIAILLGQTPESMGDLLQAPPPNPTMAPPVLPPGLPSDLLQRRPDVRVAERRLAAANAQVGVQVANQFPKLNLLGLASFAGTDLSGLFSSDNLSTVGVGMLTQPIFDAGKLRAGVRAAKEERAQALLAYRKAGLAALQDVEDALSRHAADEARRASLARSLISSQNSLAIARDQYQVGLQPFIDVIQAENAELNARDQLAQADSQVQTDLVALYKALGGGWSVSAPAAG